MPEHPIRKTIYLLASYTMIFPPIGIPICLLLAMIADHNGWSSQDVGG